MCINKVGGKMYRLDKRKLNNIFIQIVIIGLSVFFGILVYIIYLDGQIYTYEKTAYGTKLAKEIETKIIENSSSKNVINEAMKSIVGISRLKDNGTSVFLTKGVESLGIGTGIIVSSKGYILTNQHLVGDKLNVCYITLDTGVEYKGKVVWSDSEIDLAIVKIGVENLNPIKLGDSDNISIGQNVYAIGNPVGFEFEKTVTSGIISGTKRTLKIRNENNKYSYMESLIQTDATINEGNSGGALINELGEVIGITSVKVTDADGIGFAIPINMIKTIIAKFENTGKFNEAYLGIYGYDKEVIPYLKDVIDFESGIYVADINENSNLKKSSIKAGDIIVKIDDVNLTRMTELREYIYTKNPGDVVNLRVKRSKKEFIVQVKLNKKL